MSDEKLVVPNADEGAVGTGFAIGAILNVGLVVLMMLLTALTGGVLLFVCAPLVLGIGLVQCVYIGPIYYRYQRSGKRNAARGLMIAAAVTALLNATCWGWVLFT